MKVIVITLNVTILINLVSANKDFEMELAKTYRVRAYAGGQHRSQTNEGV